MPDLTNPPQNSPNSLPSIITTRQVAARLASSMKTVRRLVDSGTLRAYRIAGRGPLRFHAADVERLLIPAQKPDLGDDLDAFITHTRKG